MAGVEGPTIHLEDDVLLEQGVGLDDQESVIRRLHAIVDQIAAKCQAAVTAPPATKSRKSSKKSPHAQLLEFVQKVDNNVETKKMLDLSKRTLQRAYDLLLATCGELDGNNSYVVREGARVDSNLLVISCRLLKKVYEGEVEEDLWMLADDLTNAILTIIQHSVSEKKAAYENDVGGPMNLNHEVMLLKYLKGIAINEDVETVLGDVSAILHYKNATTEIPIVYKEDVSDYLERLFSRGKYSLVTKERAENSTTKLYGNVGQCVIDAKIKEKCFIDFDEHGLPFSNDVTPQHPWADFREYRKKYLNADKTVQARFPGMGEESHSKYDIRPLVVAEQLQLLKRASVAELLRKLVNKDLDYGEGQDVSSTEVGIFAGKTDVLYSSIITRNLGDDFRKTKVPLADLYEPLRQRLEAEMQAFEKVLWKRYGDKYKILPSRVKSLESVLLKMLKEKKTTVGSITDLIGFTVLTDTEAEAEQVYAEVKDMMVPEDIKETDMWKRPSKRGRRSHDITGVPQGFNTRIQVQCTTKKFDAQNIGQYSNHDAYKFLSGTDLLNKINENPGMYLDLLYRALHNMRVASYILKQAESRKEQGMQKPESARSRISYDGTPASLMALFSRDYSGGLSIVRTWKLY